MNDLIRRSDALDVLITGEEMLIRVLDDMDVVGNEREKYAWGLGLIESCIDDMRDLPSAQPERQNGAWLEYIPEHGKCPFCGNQVDLLSGKANNFCGECGADMRGKEDE